MSESYYVEVETFGEGNRMVLVHTSHSELESWIQKDYDVRQEIVDDMYQADFNYEIKEFSKENIYDEVLGDRMGFTGELGDFNYTIINIGNIQPINLDQIKEKANE